MYPNTYIFLHFLVFSIFYSNEEFSISSSCNQMLMFRSAASGKKEFRREGRKNEQSKPQQRRSYSFPSRSTKSSRFLENESEIGTWRHPSECQDPEITRKKSLHHTSRKMSRESIGSSINFNQPQSFSSNIARKQQKQQAEASSLRSKYHEMSCFDDADRYELEAARPRRSQSELVFNVFDCVAKDVDFNDYLQPSNLRPFGSNDNIYLPLITPRQKITTHDESTHDSKSVTVDPQKVNKSLARNETDFSQSYKYKKDPSKFKETKPYKEILRKHKELNPNYASKLVPPKIPQKKSSKIDLNVFQSAKSLNREKPSDESDNVLELYSPRKAFTKSSVKIEPPPFLSKREDNYSSISFGDMNLGAKRNIANYRRVQPPWPAYSDHVKNMAKKFLVTYPPSVGADESKTNAEASPPHKLSPSQVQNPSTDNPKKMESPPRSPKAHEMAANANNMSQRRSLSMDHMKDFELDFAEPVKSTKSSVYLSKDINKLIGSNSLFSPNARGVDFPSSHNLAQYSVRKLEPKKCKTAENKKRCFLPSKVRLKPPKCITRPPPCPEEKCPERADACLKECSKQLPVLKDSDCECFEPVIPNQSPKMKRLRMKFYDEPRVCPCKPVECPCPPPQRADDCFSEKQKKLVPHVPKDCACIEPPRLIDVPLKRLQKVCEPRDMCWPKRECPVETCEDKYRADMCLVEKPKRLPVLKDSDCECYEPIIPHQNPKMKRLRMKFVDEPRVCPCMPKECPCPPPQRADDCFPEKLKKLVPHVPKDCACIEPPRLIDVPLIRLQKVCEPEEKCYPKKECVVETCEDRERADDCLLEKPKKLRPLEPKPCPCIDYRMKEAPKLKRLRLKVPEPPRVCPPPKVCPPPEMCARADDCAPQVYKKLRPIKPGECPCIEQRLVDAPPLPRLKCEEPDECVEIDPCQVEHPRADWGCWEYLQDVNPVEKCDKHNKHPSDLNYKQKRTYNTDSRMRVQRSANVASEEINIKKSSGDKIASKPLEHYNNKKRPGTHSQDSRAATLPRNMSSNRLWTEQRMERKTVSNKKVNVTKPVELNRNNSLPTIFLLKELGDMNANNQKSATLADSHTITNLSRSSNRRSNSAITPNVRKLSTVVNNQKRPITSDSTAPTEPPASCDKKKKDPEKCKKDGRRTCPKMSKCPEGVPVKVPDCPPKERSTCTREKVLVCCEKKVTPNPAFSECMEEEIKPFSNTSQWSCDRREYGFEPNPKKAYEPLDTARDRKRFSTAATLDEDGEVNSILQTVENPIVSYFSARYSKPKVEKEPRNGVKDLTAEDQDVKQDLKREALPVEDTASDVNGGKVSKDTEVKHPKPLNQRINGTVAGLGCSRKMSTNNKSYSTLHSNGSGLLTFHLYSRPNIQKKNLSSLKARTIPGTTSYINSSSIEKIHRDYCDDCPKKPHKPGCKLPKKKGCPKFQLDNCPEKQRETCHLVPPVIKCEVRPQAPYPAFSDLIDNEIEEKLTECPMEKEKIQLLQPRYPIPLNKPKLLPPENPHQGKIDPKIEERCIREKLCLKNEGLSQDCSNFGEYIKPLKSKRFFKEINRECEKIEQLKKLGKWPPKRHFCSWAQSHRHTVKGNDCHQAGNVNATKPVSSTDFDTHSLNGEARRKLRHTQSLDTCGPCKYRKFRNVQWKIDDNWNRHSTKSNHITAKQFSTSAVKTHSNDTSVRGAVYSVLNCKRLRRDVIGMNISTSRTLGKSNKFKSIRFPLYPKSSKQYKATKCPTRVKVSSPPATSIQPPKKKKKFPIPKINILQPKYPSVPEIDTISIPPYRPMVESSWEKECLVHFTGKCKKEGSYEFTSAGKPFIRVNSSTLDRVKAKQRANDDEEAMVSCTPGGEVFMHRRGKCRSCPKFPRPYPCELSDLDSKRRRRTATPCAYKEDTCITPEMTDIPPCNDSEDSNCFPLKPCPAYEKKCRSSSTALLYKEADDCFEMQTCPPCSKKSSDAKDDCSDPVSSLWHRIMNYFKARPNCPAPDEWKKRALREKAEKAARAAGLCLCEPQDHPRNVSKNPKKCSTKKTGKSSKSNDEACFPARSVCKTSTRGYCSRGNRDNSDKAKKLLEEEKKKQLAKKMSQILMEELGQEEDSQKCPDPFFEGVLKEVILSRNSLTCLDKPAVKNDTCVSYSLKIFPSDVNILENCIKEASSNDGVSRKKEHVSVIEGYMTMMDRSSEVAYEEIEKVKTKNMVNELDSLLAENQSRKKN